jgi:hypothetical protein
LTCTFKAIVDTYVRAWVADPLLGSGPLQIALAPLRRMVDLLSN